MFVYHGVFKENLESMKMFGVHSNSYWGNIEEALKYSDCDTVIRINIENTNYNFKFNELLLDYYLNSGDDDELLEEWNNSNKTIRDSLDIFGSIILEDVFVFNESDLIKGSEIV